MNKKLIICLSLVCWYTSHAQVPCNGYSEFCDRRYNQVCVVGTHNSQSYRSTPSQNQDRTITQQLQDGVRQFKIPIHWDYDTAGKKMPFACHGIYLSTLYTNYFEKALNVLPVNDFTRPIIDGLRREFGPLNDLIINTLKSAYGTNQTEGVLPFHPCVLDGGGIPLVDVLKEMKAFLDQNRGAIITINLEDLINDLDALAQLFQTSGLDTYAHAQDKTKLWPTLGEMVTSNKRAVIFIKQQRSGNYPWQKYLWMNNEKDYFFGMAEYGFTASAALAADARVDTANPNFQNRFKDPKNKLFLINHFLTPIMAGTKAGAKTVNERNFLRTRVKKAIENAQYMPMVLQVDFYEYPNMDIFDVVNEINGVGKYAGKPLVSMPNLFQTTP